MAVLFFSAVGLLSAQRTVVLRDRQDSTGIEGVQLLFRDGSNNIVLAAFTDNRGQCDVGDAILEKSSSLKFQRVGYSTDSVALSASLAFPLVVYLRPSGNLKGVTVDARRSLYKFLPNKLAYQVDRDSSMRDKSSFEALQNMPGLIVTNAGDFKTIDNKTLIFKMNGLRNPLLGGNIKNVLDALPANTLKRIESSTEYGNSSPTLVVNFVTKGQVEGYLAAATNNVGDRQWFSSLYGLTKANRLTIDACYSGTLRYGHPSDSRTTEERESGDVLQLDRLIHAQGVRSYRPSYEVTASYDIDDHSIISVYGRFCHINNERDNETETVSLLGRRPGQFATIDKLRKMTGRSHEYWAEAYFERGYGENAEDGLFNVGYLFDGDDSKPTKTEVTGTFATDPDLLGAVISNDYYSYTQRQQTYSRNHTLETSFRRKWRGKHYVECNAKVRFSENSDKKQLFSEALSPAGDAERNSYYNSQLTSELYLNYGL